MAQVLTSLIFKSLTDNLEVAVLNNGSVSIQTLGGYENIDDTYIEISAEDFSEIVDFVTKCKSN